MTIQKDFNYLTIEYQLEDTPENQYIAENEGDQEIITSLVREGYTSGQIEGILENDESRHYWWELIEDYNPENNCNDEDFED